MTLFGAPAEIADLDPRDAYDRGVTDGQMR